MQSAEVREVVRILEQRESQSRAADAEASRGLFLPSLPASLSLSFSRVAPRKKTVAGHGRQILPPLQTARSHFIEIV